MPPPKHHANDPNYPECNQHTFVSKSKLIAVPLSDEIQKITQQQEIENDGYDVK